MMYRIRYRLALAAIILATSLCVLIPGFLFQNSSLPRLHLGLDLRGGVQLTLEVDTLHAILSALISEGQRLKRLADDNGIAVEGPVLNGLHPKLILNDAAHKDQLLRLISANAPNILIQSIDSGEGNALTLTYDFTPEYTRQTASLAVAQVLKIIGSRIDQFGVSEPDIRRQANNRILIQLPGMDNARRATRIIGQTAQMSFHLVRSDLRASDDSAPPPDAIFLPMKTGGLIAIEKTPLLNGDAVADARPSFNERNEPMVSLTLNRQAADVFAHITEQNVGRRLAIVLDGQVHSAPVIQKAIRGGAASIVGRFSIEEAQDLAITLRSGSLPAPVSILEDRAVGPALGEASVRGGVLAALLGAVMVLVIMPLRYGVSGLLADGLLSITLLLLLAGMTAFGATLTLPGIAGIVLTIGMAVDANVLIFERIREELAAGLSPRNAVSAGFERATLAIFDSNLTTILVAAILFQFGTGPVKGFSVTLTLGILASMYTALSLCRIVFELLLRSGRAISITGIWHGQQLVSSLACFPYLRHAGKVVIGAVLLALAAIVSFELHGPHYGVDFVGGTEALLTFERPVTDSDIAHALKPLDLDGLSLQSLGNDSRTWKVRFALPEGGASPGLGASLVETLTKHLPGSGVYIAYLESVGPKAGNELRYSAMEALYYAILLITIYISGRFEHRWGTAAILAGVLGCAMYAAGLAQISIPWRMLAAFLLTLGLCWKMRLGFAVGAIVSLLFDVVVTYGILTLLREEIDLNVVAAILTVIGYSLNDTIVIFDRIREVLRRKNFDRNYNIIQIISQGLADTMSRTLFTGGTTLAAALALYLFGGTVIHGFALTMIIGVLAGTLSSLFVAAPLLTLFSNCEPPRASRGKRQHHASRAS